MYFVPPGLIHGSRCDALIDLHSLYLVSEICKLHKSKVYVVRVLKAPPITDRICTDSAKTWLKEKDNPTGRRTWILGSTAAWDR